MENVNLDDERERHWRMVFKDNYGGVVDKNTFIHAKKWDFYVNKKENLIKGGYWVEFVGHIRKKVIWKVQDDNVVEEATDHCGIGIRGFNSIFLRRR